MAVHIGSMFFRGYGNFGFLRRKRFCFAFTSRGGDWHKGIGGAEEQSIKFISKIQPTIQPANKQINTNKQTPLSVSQIIVLQVGFFKKIPIERSAAS